MSHSACHNVLDSVLGQVLRGPQDIHAIGARVRARSLDLLQAAHVLSGIDMALWDLLGHLRGEPVWRLLGYARTYPKLPYASVLFGDAGTVWVENVDRARQSLPALHEARATWLEEPFVSGALHAYADLARAAGSLRLAGGEGAHDYYMARQMIDHAGIGFVQIDAGRVGGISEAKRVADYALARGVTYVNHTFTSQLALSASLQPFAGLEHSEICEYPLEARAVAYAIALERIERDAAGLIHVPEGPGFGMHVDPARFRPYLVDAEIRVAGKVLYRTPTI
jgi:L-alanine-DL-glutamate epimerase-like enolase superfamily enzyme